MIIFNKSFRCLIFLVVTILWTVNLSANSGSSNWEYCFDDEVQSLSYHKDNLIINTEHKIWSINSYTGNVVWTVLENNEIKGFEIYNDLIIVNARMAVRALDIYTGKEKWPAVLGCPVTNMKVTNDRVFCACYDGSLFVLNVYSGEILWKYQMEPNLPSKFFVWNNDLIAVIDYKYIYQMNIFNGSIVAQTGCPFDNPTNAVVWGDALIFPGNSGISAYNMRTHQMKDWLPQYTANKSSLYRASDLLFFSSRFKKQNSGYNYYAINISTGRELWNQSFEAAIQQTLYISNYLMFIYHPHAVIAINPNSGQIFWSHPVDDIIHSSLAYGNNLISFCTWDGDVYILSEKTGEIISHATLNQLERKNYGNRFWSMGVPRTNPVFQNNSVFIGLNNCLYSLRLYQDIDLEAYIKDVVTGTSVSHLSGTVIKINVTKLSEKVVSTTTAKLVGSIAGGAGGFVIGFLATVPSVGNDSRVVLQTNPPPYIPGRVKLNAGQNLSLFVDLFTGDRVGNLEINIVKHRLLDFTDPGEIIKRLTFSGMGELVRADGKVRIESLEFQFKKGVYEIRASYPENEVKSSLLLLVE